MDWEVIWTEAAMVDFETAVRTAARHSEAAAESLREAILQSVGTLAKLPEIGPVYETRSIGGELARLSADSIGSFTQ